MTNSFPLEMQTCDSLHLGFPIRDAHTSPHKWVSLCADTCTHTHTHDNMLSTGWKVEI